MKIAIITGASSGMGKEFVVQADKRYSLDEIWVIARREDRLIALQNDVSAKIVPLALDLTLESSFSILKQNSKRKTPRFTF